MKEAIIAIEDHYFYSHIGINIKRILKTIWVDLTSLSFAQVIENGSKNANIFQTVPPIKVINKQQFFYFLWIRKLFKEILLAFQIESCLKKMQYDLIKL